MLILGLSAFSHDAAAALIEDGRIIALVEEERLSRKKHASEFPLLAIRECLRIGGRLIEDVDCFAFFNRPELELFGGLRHGVRFFPGSLNLLTGTHGGDAVDGGLTFAKRVVEFWTVQRRLRQEFALKRRPRVRFVEHHIAHAASAFYPSPFKDAAIVTWDGRGEFACTVGCHGSERGIRKIFQTDMPHSIGHLYSAVTDYLGFRPFFDESKVMGLSAYGSPAYVERFQALYEKRAHGDYRLNLDYFQFQYFGRRKFLSDAFTAAFGPARKPDEPLEQHHWDIAFALQRSVEDLGLHVTRHLRQATGSPRLCLAGGVAQNILLNTKIAEEAGFDEIFVQPVSTDAGSALGAALVVASRNSSVPRTQPLQDVYFGPEYVPDDIERALKASGVRYERPAEITRSAARALADGKIVGWFQGRMEAGPRALGNRSLLSNPCKPEFKERMNRRIKHREDFRPFAPAILEERAGAFFDGLIPLASPFMVASANVAPSARTAIPAVVHVDGSARPQTVSKRTNPLFWELISEFDRITGVPVLLNTSFNEQEPIVCSPEDAIRTFLRTDVDSLAIGPFWVEKESRT